MILIARKIYLTVNMSPSSKQWYYSVLVIYISHSGASSSNTFRNLQGAERSKHEKPCRLSIDLTVKSDVFF